MPWWLKGRRYYDHVGHHVAAPQYPSNVLPSMTFKYSPTMNKVSMLSTLGTSVLVCCVSWRCECEIVIICVVQLTCVPVAHFSASLLGDGCSMLRRGCARSQARPSCYIPNHQKPPAKQTPSQFKYTKLPASKARRRVLSKGFMFWNHLSWDKTAWLKFFRIVECTVPSSQLLNRYAWHFSFRLSSIHTKP